MEVKVIGRNGYIITCQIDGNIVEGAVKIHPKEICVKLLMDGIDLAAFGKLMLMAPMTYTTGINTCEPNDYCLTRLQELMTGLYHDYLVIMGNREKIRALLPIFLKAKDECNRTVTALNKQKSHIKKDFLEGRLSQKSYMNRLKDLKNQIYNQQQALNQAFAEIFTPTLSECSHCDNLIRAIETL